MRALGARLAPHWVARAAHDRLRANGVDVSAPEVERAWQRIVPLLRRESGVVAFAFAKTIIHAWTTSRRMHDVHALPCVFGCAADAGERTTFACANLWSAVEQYSGVPACSPVPDRLALSQRDDATKFRAARGVALAFRLYHTIKVAWATSLPADPRRWGEPPGASPAGLSTFVKAICEGMPRTDMSV